MPKQKQGKKLRRTATRDIRTSYKPQMQEFGQQRKQARRETQQGIRGARQTYETLENTLEGLAPRFQEQSKDIRQNYMGDVEDISGMFAGQTVGAPGEGNAGRHLAATMAGGGSEILAAQAARNNAYNTSSIRRAGIERKDVVGDYRQNLTDFLTDLKSQRMDTKQAMGPQILSRIDELRSNRQQMSLAKREQEMREKQFGKTFNYGKKQDKQANKKDNRANDALAENARNKRRRRRNKWQRKNTEPWRRHMGGSGAMARAENQNSRNQGGAKKRRKKRNRPAGYRHGIGPRGGG